MLFRVKSLQRNKDIYVFLHVLHTIIKVYLLIMFMCFTHTIRISLTDIVHNEIKEQ